MDTQKKWESTRITNLIRYVPTGEYFVRRRFGGEARRIPLGTSVFTVAKWKMGDVVRSAPKAGNRSTTALQLLEEWVATKTADPNIKPSTARFLRCRLASVKSTWPDLSKLHPSKVGPAEVAAWAANYCASRSVAAYNGSLRVFRGGMAIAVERGLIPSDPTCNLKQRRQRPKDLRLPTHDQIAMVLLEMGRMRSGFKRGSAELAAFLAYSGLRVFSEAWWVRWSDIDLESGRLTVRGDPALSTKNGKTRVVPIIHELRDLLLQIKARGVRPDGRVMEVRHCGRALSWACRVVGVPNMSHHDLRHLFATRCLSSGVDVPTVAKWLGHQDGGALLLKVYSHVLQSHSQEMAKMVRIGSASQPADKADNHSDNKPSGQGASTADPAFGDPGADVDESGRGQADDESSKHEAECVAQVLI